MSPTKIALSSLALDLRRVALGYHRHSKEMAERFFDEALKRKEEIDKSQVKPYINNLLLKLESLKLEKRDEDKAENALMYSTLFQNAAVQL